ncbi:hypothetical protein GCM10010214_59540 [Streptomyces abikoensis]|nr:hypothetical protein GCM10010214_59540 [Streptomyces abikoensis]
MTPVVLEDGVRVTRLTAVKARHMRPARHGKQQIDKRTPWSETSCRQGMMRTAAIPPVNQAIGCCQYRRQGCKLWIQGEGLG